MITVEAAEALIQNESRDFGNELIAFQNSPGRILAEDVFADRDFPAFNRATMDGIGISFSDIESGIRNFNITGTQGAGDTSIPLINSGDCVEVMTGCSLHPLINTVIRYEDLEIQNGKATVKDVSVLSGQSIHKKGSDRKDKSLLVPKDTVIEAAIIGILASVGKSEVLVKKLPRVAVVSTGNELIEVIETPKDFQIRRSNNYMIEAALKNLQILPDSFHLKDDLTEIVSPFTKLVDKYDVLIISGGISMGKLDFIPKALEQIGVSKIFHGVQQRPGKPFYFGKHSNGTVIFALPGNPVSSYFCFIRYCIPWFQQNNNENANTIYAELDFDFTFKPALQYYVPANISISEKGKLIAKPIAGNGSGDFANLLDTQAFIEFHANDSEFKKGSMFRIWPFKPII